VIICTPARFPNFPNSGLLATTRNLGTRHIDSSLCSRVPSLATCSSTSLGLLAVCDKIEGDEKQEVGRKDDAAGDGCELLAGAFTVVWHPSKVCAGEVCVGREVDEACVTVVISGVGGKAIALQTGGLTKVYYKLNDLETCDPFFPPNPHTAGGLKVVPVHHDVDHEVECNRNPGYRGKTNELCVAQECSGTMVVSVQESCHCQTSLSVLGDFNSYSRASS